MRSLAAQAVRIGGVRPLVRFMCYKCAKCGESTRVRCAGALPCLPARLLLLRVRKLPRESTSRFARPPSRLSLRLCPSFPNGICKPPAVCGADGCKSRKLEEQRATAECGDLQRMRLQEVGGADPEEEARAPHSPPPHSL